MLDARCTLAKLLVYCYLEARRYGNSQAQGPVLLQNLVIHS